MAVCDFCNSNWCQVNAKHKFSRVNSDRGFLCQMLSACRHNRYRSLIEELQNYLKPSFVWNIQTMHSICFCRVSFTHLISRTLLSVFLQLNFHNHGDANLWRSKIWRFLFYNTPVSKYPTTLQENGDETSMPQIDLELPMFTLTLQREKRKKISSRTS